MPWSHQSVKSKKFLAFFFKFWKWFFSFKFKDFLVKSLHRTVAIGYSFERLLMRSTLFLLLQDEINFGVFFQRVFHKKKKKKKVKANDPDMLKAWFLHIPLSPIMLFFHIFQNNSWNLHVEKCVWCPTSCRRVCPWLTQKKSFI